MSPLYTGNGDDGTTGFLGSGRLSKFHLRIEALGCIDETSAALGLARAAALSPATQTLLVKVQRELYAAMAEVAANTDNAAKFRVIGPNHIQELENDLAGLEKQVVFPKDFILPGDSQAGAAISLARSITRRAERRLAELAHAGQLEGSSLLPYFNRLSSLLFALELFEVQASGKDAPTLAKGTIV